MSQVWQWSWTHGIVLLLTLIAGVESVQADDWLQFRGTDSSAVVSGPDLPTDLNQVSWSAALDGRGTSCPIVVNDMVVVTGSKGPRQDRLYVAAFDVTSGDQLWQREFWATGRTICHEKMAVATPTPASNGELIFASFSSNDVICLDLDGNLKWFRGLTYDYPNVSNSLGMSSSLLVHDGLVVCMAENDTQSMTFGLNATDGTTRWKLDRPRSANWTSPVIWPGAEPAVLLQSSKGVTAVDLSTGATVWEYADGASTIPSLVATSDRVYIPSNGLTALKVAPGSEPDIEWQVGQLAPATASPVVSNGRGYVINGAGVLSCADLATGKRIWQCRLEGKFSATPIISGSHLYAVNEKGLAQVVELGEEEGTVVGSHDFGQTILAAPAAAGGAIFFRSDETLWCVASNR